MPLKEFTSEEVEGIFHKIIEDILKLRKAGQQEYAHGSPFGNFNRLAGDLNIQRDKILWIFLKKHLDGILSYINGHKSQRESVHGRIRDAIVYLMLLDSMIQEDENNYNEKET